MGYGLSDRKVYRAHSSGTGSTKAFRPSRESTRALSSDTGRKALLPYNRRLVCKAAVPLVVMLDGTGSMGSSAKVIHDKRPLLWGQIEQHGYLKDPAMSFAVVGDHTCDSWPFQVGGFENKPAALDKWLRLSYLEGGGGGGRRESYAELCWYYAHCVDYQAQGPQKGYFFIIGDEAPYPKIARGTIRKHFGNAEAPEASTAEILEVLQKHYHVFCLHVPYSQGQAPSDDRMIVKRWKHYLPETVIKVDEPNSVVDVMLGIIATTEEVRSLGDYEEDLRGRKQTKARVENVRSALTPYVKRRRRASSAPAPAASAAADRAAASVKGANRTGRSKRLR